MIDPTPLASALFRALSGIAAAAPLPLVPEGDPRTYIPGGGAGLTGSSVAAMVDGTIASFGEFMVVGGGAFCVLFIVIGGFQMLISYGDEGKFDSARKSIILALVGFMLVLISQVTLAFIKSAVDPIVGSDAPLLNLQKAVVRALFALFNGIFVVIIMASGLRMTLSRGKSEEFTAGKRTLGFALAGALVMNAARAMAEALLNTLG